MRQRFWKLLQIWLLVCGSVVLCKNSKEETANAIWNQASDHTKELARRQLEERPLLVSVLDGKIAAINKDSGDVLWTFDSEQALLQAKTSADYDFAVLPGVQGELYSMKKADNSEGFQMLEHTLPGWVENTPAVMSDGSLWLGSRHTHAFFLHPRTGKLLQSFVEYGEGFPASNTSLMGDDGVEPILIGRVDYSVRAVDQKSGAELFNISYSHLRILDKDLKLPAFGDQPALESSLKPSNLNIGLDPNRKHAISKRDPETGKELWHVQFEHPPLTLFAGGETGMSLYGVPSWPPTEKVSSWIGSPSTPQPSILVNMIGESAYALPLVADQQNNLKGLIQEIGVDESAMEEPRETVKQLTEDQEHAAKRGVNQSGSLLLGVHSLQTANSPLSVSVIVEGSTREGAGVKLERTATQGVWFTTNTVGGSILALAVVVYQVTKKPKMMASTRTDEHGAQITTFDYTGTTEQAAEASKHSRQFAEAENGKAEPIIKDFTGSGVEHFPETEERKGSDAYVQRGSSDSSEAPSTSSKKRKKKRKSGSTGSREGQRSQFATPEAQAQEQGQSSGPSGSDAESEDARGQQDGEFAGPRLASKIPQKSVDAMLDEDSYTPSRERDPSVETAKTTDLLAPETAVLPLVPTSVPGSGVSNATNMTTALRQPQWKDGTLSVGRLVVGPGIVGYGSSGTLVFEGSLDGRNVAVKRILRQFYQLARKEIAALIVADEHPNVVRCFAMEECSEFVYLALERCKQSLNDMLGDLTAEKSLTFCNPEGQPTPLCLKICEEIGNGLLALHQSGIVHRDLKPHNVLLTEGQRTKLSDMGLCKRLTSDQTSYDSAQGGSSGWQAPEQLILRNGGQARQGKSVDIFSYGLLLHYCLTGGQHPFGEGFERDYRILNGKADLSALKHLPEAANLIRAMLRPTSKQRPSISAIMAHPFWWPASQKLSFLIDISNRLETEDRVVDRSLLQALEASAEEAIGGNDWSQSLEAEFLANLGKYRKYQPHSLRDLLRVVRNKHNHFREMPEELQNRIGRTPEQYYRYFASLFPNLLQTTYAFALKHCGQEPVLHKYFPAAAYDFPFASAAVVNRFAQSSHFSGPTLKSNQDRSRSAPGGVMRQGPLATIPEIQAAMDRSKSDTNCMLPPAALPNRKRRDGEGPKTRGWWSDSSSQSDTASVGRSSMSSDSDSQSSKVTTSFLNPDDYKSSDPSQKTGTSSSKPTWKSASSDKTQMTPPSTESTSDWPSLPSLVKSEDQGGMIPVVLPPVAFPEPDEDGTVTVDDDALTKILKASMLPTRLRTVRDAEGWVTVFPQRTEEGATVCEFFAKTGACKYGQSCHFHHPLTYSVKMNHSGLPLRPGQASCPYYERTGSCKFGAACKFHHPPDQSSSPKKS